MGESGIETNCHEWQHIFSREGVEAAELSDCLVNAFLEGLIPGISSLIQDPFYRNVLSIVTPFVNDAETSLAKYIVICLDKVVTTGFDILKQV